MRIALDAMGGDNAPHETVKGALWAVQELGIEVILVGRAEELEAELSKHPKPGPKLLVEPASEVIAMEEHPAMAVRNKMDSSLVRGFDLIKRGAAVAFVSAGNSGATVVAALLALGRIRGVERPAIATLFPTSSGAPFLCLDVGANADCRPNFLLQFAKMGSLYMEKVIGVGNPRVVLLSIGEEENKGNQLIVDAHALLKKSDLNFVGNLEGQHLLDGLADVVVTDGFTGNVLLKVSEGLCGLFLALLKGAFQRSLPLQAAAPLLKPALAGLSQLLDYAEYGGAPLLGVEGTVIIAHGRSDAQAIKNALRQAKLAVDGGVVEAIREGFRPKKAVGLSTSEPG